MRLEQRTVNENGEYISTVLQRFAERSAANETLSTVHLRVHFNRAGRIFSLQCDDKDAEERLVTKQCPILTSTQPE